MQDVRTGLLHIFNNVQLVKSYETIGMHQVFVIELSSVIYLNALHNPCEQGSAYSQL